jgi:hypothetical protein
MHTRRTRIFSRDARLSHPIAALRLLAIGQAITRRRALLSGTIDTPRSPKTHVRRVYGWLICDGLSAKLAPIDR